MDSKATWTTPECPFAIEYSTRVLDDIRLAVIDAFFSLPKGGAEIGGVLMGKHGGDTVEILDYVAMECEHALGPSFTLSARDLNNLEKLLWTNRDDDLVPVGWYHSHTRTEIFLSDVDQEVHRKFFPKAWQVALVLKPHAFMPTRGGFFFQEAGGAIHGEKTYREFVVEALPMRQVSADIVSTSEAELFRHEKRVEPKPAQPVIEVAPLTPKPAPVVQMPAPKKEEPKPVELKPEDPRKITAPKFQVVTAESNRHWTPLALIVLGMVLGAAVYQTRSKWMPVVSGVSAKGTSQSAAPAAQSPAIPDPALAKERDDLKKENQQLKADLATQTELAKEAEQLRAEKAQEPAPGAELTRLRTDLAAEKDRAKKAEAESASLKKQIVQMLRDQSKKRMTNQARDAGKQ